MIFNKYQTISILITFTLLLHFSINSVDAQSNSTLNTFSDPETGISFQYPSGWQIAPEEYSEFLTESTKDHLSDKGIVDKSSVVVDMLPKSNSEAFFTIISEKMPFPMTGEQYLESTKESFNSFEFRVEDVIPFSIGGIESHKYNIIAPDGFTQTQILFTKDLVGYTINYYLGQTDQSGDNSAIKLMLNSFDIR